MSATATSARQIATDEGLDPIGLVKSLTALVRSTGLYPAGHTVIQQALASLDAALQAVLEAEGAVRLDVINGDVHLDGRAFHVESQAHPQAVRDFTDDAIGNGDRRGGHALDDGAHRSTVRLKPDTTGITVRLKADTTGITVRLKPDTTGIHGPASAGPWIRT